MAKSYKKGALYSSGLSFVAKIIAFAQQLCIAYYCGINTTTDIYFYLINLAFLVGGMIQMVTSSILIPRSMELRSNKGPLKEMAFLNAFLLLVFGIGLALMAILGILGQHFMDLITRFDSGEIALNLPIYYIFLPVTFLIALNSVFAEIFVSYKYFTSSVWLNLVLISSLFFASILLHGIYGGLLLREKLNENHRNAINNSGTKTPENFEYDGLHWSTNHEKWYDLAASIIIKHNIWFANTESNDPEQIKMVEKYKNYDDSNMKNFRINNDQRI